MMMMRAWKESGSVHLAARKYLGGTLLGFTKPKPRAALVGGSAVLGRLSYALCALHMIYAYALCSVLSPGLGWMRVGGQHAGTR